MRLLCALFAATAACSVSAVLTAQEVPACSPDADARAGLRAWVMARAMAQDTASLRGRTRVQLQIPLVTDTAAVRPITDAATCERLRKAFTEALHFTPPALELSVVVVQVDTVYVVLDPSQRGGHYIVAAVYGPSLTKLKQFLY